MARVCCGSFVDLGRAFTGAGIYQSFGKKPQTASPAPGDNAVYKQQSGPQATGCPGGDCSAQDIESQNNWGPANTAGQAGTIVNQAAGCWYEGGGCSDFMDNLPFMNATATIHDIWGDMYEAAYGGYPTWFKIGTYIPAYTLGVTASLDTTMGAAMAASVVSNNTGGGP